MKKVFIVSLILSASAFSASAWMLNLSCNKAIQTIPPECLPEKEWKEFVAEMEEAYCNQDSDKEETEPTDPNPAPGQSNPS